MLRSAKYIEEHNIIHDDVNSFKKGKGAQVGFDLSVKNIWKIVTPGFVSKTKTHVPPYLLMKSDDVIYPYAEGGSIWFKGWRLDRGTYILECNEGVHFGPNDTGYIIMRSSLNRTGASIQSAVWDPGFTTQDDEKVNTITIRLTVDTDEGFYLEQDARVAQLLVMENEDTVGYGTTGESQFQGGRRQSSK